MTELARMTDEQLVERFVNIATLQDEALQVGGGTMELGGIKDLLPFLNLLRSIRDVPWYRLAHSRDDAITVAIDMPETRLEIDFFDDHIEYSLFEGDESVLDDQARLFALIKERGK